VQWAELESPDWRVMGNSAARQVSENQKRPHLPLFLLRQINHLANKYLLNYIAQRAILAKSNARQVFEQRRSGIAVGG
jgi:hypothetical protein